MALSKRILRIVLSTLTAVVLISAFFVAVIMGNPQPVSESAPTPAPAPLTETLSITSVDGFSALLNAFPAPVMAAGTSSVLKLESAVCENIPYAEGIAVVATLRYQTADAQQVTVQSIVPAEALDVMGKGDFTITGEAGHPLASIRSVQMVSPTQVRMHAAREGVLYVITMPTAPDLTLRSWTSAMQLYQGEQP